MTHADRKTRFEPAADASPAPRPQIWVEGQQRPRFNLTAFGTVALAMAKRDLAPEMVDAAQRLQRVGLAVAQGQRRLTPRRFASQDRRVGGWVLALASLFRGAHTLLDPAEADQTLAYPSLGPDPRPVPAARPLEATRPMPAARPSQVRDEPTLQAIRSAMFYELPDPAPPPPYGADAPPPPGTEPGSALWTLACHGLLTLLLAFALPLAALRAWAFHLHGGDLADWS